MKPLKPSHREDKRYLLIKGEDANFKIIDEVILEFLGVLGYADVCPKIIYTSDKSLILSINRKMIDKVRACFLMSRKDLRIEKVSGSVKGVRN